MRKLTVLLLLITVILTGANVLAQDPIFLTTRSELNVRSLPSLEAPSLQVAPQGTTILAIGRNAATTWTQVEFKGVIGWVSNAYVAASGDLNSLPITDATAGTVNPRPQEQVSAPDGTIVQAGTLVVFADQAFVNVRALPDETGQVDIGGFAFPVGGDIITAINGVPIREMDDLVAFLAESTRPNDQITVTILREGQLFDVSVILEARPDSSR